MSPQNRLITLNNGVQMPILGFGVFQVPDEQTAPQRQGQRARTTASASGTSG